MCFGVAILSCAFALTLHMVEGRVYYVHPEGDNANSGLTEAESWRYARVILREFT